MKILYGIQGTGNGHLARARALVPELYRLGIEVDFIFSGREKKNYFNMDIFGDDYRCLEGFTFAFEQGRLQKIKTVLNNNPAQLIRDIYALDVSPYDLVISDFEPVTAWAAGIKGKKSLGISHQAAFRHAIPKVTGSLTDRLIMRGFAPVDYSIGLHWHHFNTSVIPPLIEPLTHQAVNPRKILVYMGFESLKDITGFVSGFSDYEFHIYAKVDHEVDLGHIQIKPLSHKGFHRDLLDCAGVIANAGFELASECMYLGRKLLVKPLLGQYEQVCNALALQVLGRGTVVEQLDREILASWLALDAHAPVLYPNVARHLAQWIVKGNYDTLEPLVQSLWSGIPALPGIHPEMPDKLRAGLIF